MAWKKKSKLMSNMVGNFNSSMISNGHFLTWEDSSNMWDRVSCEGKDVLKIISETRSTQLYYSNIERMRSEGDINDETPLDSELVMKWCKRRGLPAGAERILSTPFFKKWINDRCAEVLAKVNDANENNRIKTFEGWYKIEHLLSIVEAIAAVWDDVPVDYFQTHLDELMLTGSFNISRSTHDWLRKNMPVSSLFQAIKRNVLQQ
ncbi:MAG: hypothetical protein EBX94_04890, partial [Burkholderiaceae bacterium]|nr:hypothetical protein [Burkholderiaceae bacterium]